MELLFANSDSNSHARFIAGTEYDSARANPSGDGRFLTQWLEFPLGLQTLKIQLHTPDTENLPRLRHIIIHKKLTAEHSPSLGQAGFSIYTSKQSAPDTIHHFPGSLSFFTQPTMAGKVITLDADEILYLHPYCDHEAAVDQIRVWLDFEQIESLSPPLSSITVNIPSSGRKTLNMEIIGKSGEKRIAQVDIVKQ